MAAIAAVTLAALALALPALHPIWIVLCIALGLIAALDLVLGSFVGCPISVERLCAHSWSLDVAQPVILKLRHMRALRWPFAGELFDHVPPRFSAEPMPQRFALRANLVTSIEYRATAHARGLHRFGGIELRVSSPFRLWAMRHIVSDDAHGEVRVYPNFARVVQYALLATDNRLSQIGVLHRRRRGEGLEFHQLREYREGDSPRQIDWKASSRYGKLIAREYQDEKNQQIVFLLDCGQRMAARDALDEAHPELALSHFDHTLNAMLLLSYVALKQGDSVGLSTFAHASARHFAPRRSAATMNLLMNAVYDLEPSQATSDFVAACQGLTRQLRKRSLIIFLTNLRDEDDDTLELALGLLRPRHMVMIASLREPGLAAIRERPVADFDGALTYSAALEYQQGRERAIAKLRKRGVPCVDVTAANLPIALVNQYWNMKRSGLI